MALSRPADRREWKVGRARRLRKLERLMSELSPRTEFIERWVDELTDVADEMTHLVRAYKDATNSVERAKRGADLRDGQEKYHLTADELIAAVRVLKKRRLVYQRVRRELA